MSSVLSRSTNKFKLYSRTEVTRIEKVNDSTKELEGTAGDKVMFISLVHAVLYHYRPWIQGSLVEFLCNQPIFKYFSQNVLP